MKNTASSNQQAAIRGANPASCFCLLPPRSRGFTLIETLVAIAIMTLAIAGPLYTANRAIVAAQNARDQLTASYLAQEGIEYVRMVRDNEYLAVRNQPNASNLAWTNFINLITTKCGTSCQFEPSNNSLNACSGSCTPLNLVDNGTTKIYTQISGGTATSFTRTIQAIVATSNDEKIVSTVSWSFHGTPYTVTITDHLTPWQ